MQTTTTATATTTTAAGVMRQSELRKLFDATIRAAARIDQANQLWWVLQRAKVHAQRWDQLGLQYAQDLIDKEIATLETEGAKAHAAYCEASGLATIVPA